MKAALVGLGFMGTTHLKVYERLGVEVVAVVDANPERLAHIGRIDGNIAVEGKAAKLKNVRRYASVGDCLQDGDFDFVDICLPTFLHAETAIAALEMGFPVICEKPMALNVEQCKAMIAAAKQVRQPLAIGQCIRYWPAFVEMKSLMQSKQFGELCGAQFSRFSAVPNWSADNWMLDAEKSGGPVLDLHIHDVDYIYDLLGMPNGLLSQAVKRQGNITQIATVYDYENKAISAVGGYVISDSFGFAMKAELQFETAVVQFDGNSVRVFPDGDQVYEPSPDDKDGYYWELYNFVGYLQNDASAFIVPPESAAQSVKLCLAELESIRKGGRIEL